MLATYLTQLVSFPSQLFNECRYHDGEPKFIQAVTPWKVQKIWTMRSTIKDTVVLKMMKEEEKGTSLYFLYLNKIFITVYN